MRRTVAVALAPLLGLALFPPTSFGASQRTVSYEYSGPNSFTDPEGNFFATFGTLTNAEVRKGERLVTVEIVDGSGRPVLAEAHQGKVVLGEPFCGTSDPLALQTRRPVHVHLHVGPGCGDFSLPTEGTISIVFER